MSDVNQLNLFGLDLSALYRRVLLGFRQVLWGDEFGLKGWLSPPVEYHQLEDIDSIINAPSKADRSGGVQMVLRDSEVLSTRLELPASAEIYLDDAVMAHVQSQSPFAPEETRWGSKIVGRSGGVLQVEIIIIARAMADAAMAASRRALGSKAVPIGLSAALAGTFIPLKGYQDEGLSTPYKANLRHFSTRLALGVLGIAFVAMVPVVWSIQTAAQYSDLLQETKLRSNEILEVREALVEAQDRVSEARHFFSGHAAYRPWLHKISAVTPDSVYLNRLAMKGDSITMSGLAVNAADYQAILVETALFSEVTAPAAFTLDTRAKRERFTLTMVVAPRADQ